ncbi:MAG: TonB-dependent receptor [Bacteroidetes bacterium]|nr:TonB-dependent receptor [Bacteroidota bacterium]
MAKLYKFIVFALILASTTLYAQSYTVSGVVTNSKTGEILIGTNVYLQALNIGGVTNVDGKYVIENVPTGTHTLRVSYIGYGTQVTSVTVNSNVELNFKLDATSISLKELVVEVNRARARKTPVAFTTLSKEQIDKNYTTQDIPGLLKEIPGVFTSSAGLGESIIFIRGFDAEHIQVLINGVPTNDPESQVVYWSNWSGLSSSATSIQVQRGVGASLVGSGSFGGSINIQTSQFSAIPRVIVRGSAGIYATRGRLIHGEFDGKSADGTGGFQNLSPSNSNISFDYTSGQLYGGKLNVHLSYERKSGDSYLAGTAYDGHSINFGLQGILGSHLITVNFIGAPQRHRQAGTVQDMDLIKTLGREYSRRNHVFQENYFFKPQYELHDNWSINEKSHLNSNFFYTSGTGGGRYLRNDDFDVNTGLIGFKSVTDATDAKYMGRNARNIFDRTGIILTGYDPVAKTMTINGVVSNVSRATDLSSGTFNHSWRNDSQNHHKQVGFNTAYTNKVNDWFTITLGGEIRHWRAQHTAQSFDFRKSNGAGGVTILNEVQRRYNYDGIVDNVSGFGRVFLNPIPELTFMLDGQWARSKQSIEENPIQIFDYAAGKFLEATFFATSTSGKFVESDYERSYNFFMPKIGANYNISNEMNFFANFSVSKKEPKVGDWFNRASGPLTTQILTEETLKNYEAGLVYSTRNFTLSANYYYLKFEDKIQSVTDQGGDRVTINAGNAIHKGIELSANGRYKKVDGSISVTVSSNKWDELNVQKIFGIDAADVIDKVVPFSPENLTHLTFGVNFAPNFRVGVTADAWNKYYGNFDNTAVLPNYYSLGAVVTYNFKLNNSDISLRFNVDNITNREQFSRAAWDRDFNRNDSKVGQFFMNVLQSPLRTAFLTVAVTL